MIGLSLIGWVATALFASSYLCKRQATLRRTQAAAAVLWVAYGLFIHAFPVVVANALVASVALYSSFRPRAEPQASPSLTSSPSRTP